jgi:hypothetical protein
LASPKILKAERDGAKIDQVQKMKTSRRLVTKSWKMKAQKGKKDHFTLVVEKGCNYLS